MSYLNQRKILLAFLTVVLAFCCYFAVRLIYAYAETDSGTLSGTTTLDADASYGTLTVEDDSVVYLDGNTLTVSSTLSVNEGATLTVYAGTSSNSGYLSVSGGTISGGVTISSESPAASSSSVTTDEYSVTVSGDALTVEDSGIIYLNGNAISVNTSLSISDDASSDVSFTVYAGTSSANDGYLTLTDGALSGTFDIEEETSGTLTVSGDSMTLTGDADIYGTIDVTEFTMSSGELYVYNSSADLNDGYALTANFLYVTGGSAVMTGSNADNDVYLTTSTGEDGSFSYEAGSFYTPQGVNVTPADLINYSLGLRTSAGSLGDQKIFTAVSKVYIDGADYKISIADTTSTTQTRNYISVYIKGDDHTISVVDGGDNWATYNLTYKTGQYSFTLSSEESTPYVDLSDGDVYVYSQYYKQNGESKWWGGQYNIITSGETNNKIIIESANDLTLSFTGGGTFTASGAITIVAVGDNEEVTTLPTFTLVFDGSTYNFSSDTAINITYGNLLVGKSGDVTPSTYSNVTIGGIYADGATVTINGGNISGSGYAVNATDSAVTINGGSIQGNTGSYGAVYVTGGTLTVNGGNIHGNTGTYAGAIYASGSTVYLNGGVIADNFYTSESGAAVICYNSKCTVDGAFIYANYKSVSGVASSSYGCDICGLNGSSIKIVSGVIYSYDEASLEDGTTSYPVDFGGDVTLSTMSFNDGTNTIIEYDFTDISLSVSKLTIYGDGDFDDYILTVYDGTATYTYALFRDGEDTGFVAAQVAESTASISDEGKHYLSGTYSSLTVNADVTLYMQGATVTTLTVNSGVTCNIYAIGTNNAIGTLTGDGAAVIDGNGKVTLSTAVSVNSLTVDGGIVDFNGNTATITSNGGAYLKVSGVTAYDAGGTQLSLLTVELTGETDVTSVTVITGTASADYGVSGTMSSLSIYVTSTSHTVVVSVSDRSYNYSVNYQDGFSYTVSDGGLTYDLSGGSVTITSNGYTKDGDSAETAFTGEYTVYGSAEDNDITVSASRTITLSGVTGGALTVSGGTVNVYLTDGTTNAFSSITVVSGATLNIYCSSGTAYLCAAAFTVNGTVNINGGAVQATSLTVASGGTLNIKGGEVSDSAITVTGAATITGGLTENSAITVSGTLAIDDGAYLSDCSISIEAAGEVTVSGGNAADTPFTVYGTLSASGGIITGGVTVSGGALTVSGGVITYASGSGNIAITGGYVYGDLTGVTDGTESGGVYLIEIELPQSVDISALTITITVPAIDEEEYDTVTVYSIGTSYTTDVLYVYGGRIDNDEIQCSVTYPSGVVYVYTLMQTGSAGSYIYALSSATMLDISENSYKLYENYYCIDGSAGDDTRYVSGGYYQISGACGSNTLEIYGGVTVYFDNVTEMSAIYAEGENQLSGVVTFTGGINDASGDAVYITGGTFAAAYIDGNVVLQDGSFTVNGDITSDGYVAVEGGEFTADGVEGSLYVSGGYVVIDGTVSADNVIIDGGSVTATFSGTPKNSTGSSLYLYTPDLSEIDGEIYSVMVDSAEYNISGDYSEMHLYLTARSHVVSIESEESYLVYNLVYADKGFTDYTSGILDIYEGSILIESDGYTVNGIKTDYTGDYIILQSNASTLRSDEATANTITVTGASVTIYLYGVAINADTDYAIYITEGSQVNIILPDGTENVITGAEASIYVDGTSVLDMSCAHAEEAGHDDCSYCGDIYGIMYDVNDDVASQSRLFYVDGTLNVNGGYYLGGSADMGGAIYVDGGTANIYGGIFYYNVATYGGAIFIDGGTANIYGGYIFGNIADYFGGAVYVYSGKLNVNGGSIQANSAYLGGGVYIEGGTFTFADGSLYTNYAEAGGAVFIDENASVYIYGGEIALNESSICGAAVYSVGTLKVYGGVITEDNDVYCDEGSSTCVYGGILSVYSYGTLKVTGGSVNVVEGDVTDGEETLYCLEISLSQLLSLEIDGEAFVWDDVSGIVDGATAPESLYIWLNSYGHLIKQVTSSGTNYYIAVYNGSGFTLNSATYTELSSSTQLGSAGYYYIYVTADDATLTISGDVTAFISGKDLSGLTVNSSTIASVYCLDSYGISTLTVNGVLIISGVTADVATVGTEESAATLKISDSQITTVTLNGSSGLILDSGEIDITGIVISTSSVISVSGTPVLTGIITITTTGSSLFADSSAAAYAKYFAYSSSYTLLKENGGLRLAAFTYNLTISITGNGSVTIDGAEYYDGGSVILAGGVAYDISYNPEDYNYLKSSSQDVSETTITLTANGALTVVFDECAVAVYSTGGTTYIGSYDTLSGAIASGAAYIALLDDTTTDVTVTSSITLDLNGCNASVTVAEGVTLTVTGEGALTVTNNGTLIVYGGIITVEGGSGSIVAYGGAFTSDVLTVKDGTGTDATTLTAVSLTLPANTVGIYVDGEDYVVSCADGGNVYLYLDSYVQYVVVNTASGYILYQSDGGLSELADVTVCDVSLAYMYINTDGTYYVLQTGDDAYGITVASGTVSLLGESDSALVINGGAVTTNGSFAGDITVNGGTLIISGSNSGDMVAEGGAVTIAGTLGGNLTVNGGEVTITGVVSGTATVNGGTLYFDGTVSGTFTANDGYVYVGTDGAAASATTYKYLYVQGGTLTVNSGSTLKVSTLSVNSGSAYIYGTLSGYLLISGGTVNINGSIDGSLTMTKGTLTIDGGIFYKTVHITYTGTFIVASKYCNVTINGGLFLDAVNVTKYAVVTINGGLFAGRVYLTSYCTVSGGAFNYSVSGKTLYAVDISGNTSVSTLTIGGTTYSGLSLTLNSTIYVAGGYSFEIGETTVVYTTSQDSGESLPEDYYTLSSSDDATYYIDSTAAESYLNYTISDYTGCLYINYSSDTDEINIYLQGCTVTLINIMSGTTITLNIYVLSGVTGCICISCLCT